MQGNVSIATTDSQRLFSHPFDFESIIIIHLYVQACIYTHIYVNHIIYFYRDVQ